MCTYIQKVLCNANKCTKNPKMYVCKGVGFVHLRKAIHHADKKLRCFCWATPFKIWMGRIPSNSYRKQKLFLWDVFSLEFKKIHRKPSCLIIYKQTFRKRWPFLDDIDSEEGACGRYKETTCENKCVSSFMTRVTRKKAPAAAITTNTKQWHD